MMFWQPLVTFWEKTTRLTPCENFWKKLQDLPCKFQGKTTRLTPCKLQIGSWNFKF